MEIKTFYGPLAQAAAQVNEYLGHDEFPKDWQEQSAKLFRCPESVYLCISVAWLSPVHDRYANCLRSFELSPGEEDDPEFRQILTAETEEEVRKLLMNPT